MILLCLILLLLHQGNADILVTTAQLGGPATLECVFPDSNYSGTRVKWYRQRVGDTLTLITTLMKGSKPTFEKGFHPSQLYANMTQTMSTLIILKSVEEDEALYHCAVTTWSVDQWRGMYLSIEGNTRRARDSAVVQWPAGSDTVHPGDAVTLQCSVLLSDSEDKACPREYSVHWFGVRSDPSHPNIIYNGGSRHDECEKKTDTRKSCVYRFSKNVTSSDAGTYYCAVATCGEILFGNGTKLNIKETGVLSFSDNTCLLLTCAVLAISVNVAAVLIYAIKNNKCDYCNNEAAVFLLENLTKMKLQRNDDARMYSTVVFNVMQPAGGGRRDAKAAERERIYAAVKAFGLE